MDQRTLGYAFVVWVAVSIPVGVGLILFGGRIAAMVGAALIMIGLMSLMPAVRFTVLREPEPPTENRRGKAG
ncbi:MAG: hypothetical protein ABEH35_08310 [Haloarculaceae archaeon]